MKLRQLIPFVAKNILGKNFDHIMSQYRHYIIIMLLSCSIQKMLTSEPDEKFGQHIPIFFESIL